MKYTPIYFKQYVRVFVVREHSDIKKEIEPGKIFKMNASDFMKPQTTQNDDVLNSSNSSGGNNMNDSTSQHKQNPSTSTNPINVNSNSNKYYKYYFVIYMRSQYTIKEGAFDIDVLSDDKLIKFDLIEHIEPFEINEKYTPNKKGILFGYYIYPSEKLTCSFDISFYHILKEIKTETSTKDAAAKAKSKSKGQVSVQETNNVYIETSPLEEKNHFIIELYHLTKEPSLDFVKDSLKFSYSNQGELIGCWHFYNAVSLLNLNFDGELLTQDKDAKKKGKKEQSDTDKNTCSSVYPYLLLCYFDLTEVDKDIADDVDHDIGYTIRVFPSNSIAFVKDTSKEDHEKLMIEEWETKDEGRSLRAVKSRKKYLLYEKSQRNEPLSTEENKELCDERERRKANQIDHIEEEETTQNAKNVKGKEAKSKKAIAVKPKEVSPKKAGKGKQQDKDKDKNEKTQDDEYGVHSSLFNYILKNRALSMKNIFETPLPRCEESKSQYVLNYVKYTYRNRTITKNDHIVINNNDCVNVNGVILANDSYRERVRKSILNKFDESGSMLKIKNSFMDKSQNEMNEYIKTLNRNISMKRMLRKDKSEKLFKARNTIKAELAKRCDIVKKLNDIMKDKDALISSMGMTGKGNNDYFTQIASVYKDAVDILGESNELVRTFFKYCSSKREESIQQDMKKFTVKDKNVIMKLLEEISSVKWDISETTINALKALIK